MGRFIGYLHGRSRLFHIGLGLALVAALGVVDYVTGPFLSMAFFYLLPVCLAAWFAGRGAGILMASAGALASLLADVTATSWHSHPLVSSWNATVELGLFVAFACVLSELRRAMDHAKELSRTDALTGAANARSFLEVVDQEVQRGRRYQHPVTLAYLDVDNFKAVNDHFGHATGDTLLRLVTDTIRCHLRAPDVVARLGGDEFAILLPETGREEAEPVLERIRQNLVEVSAQHRWPITFSLGALTWKGTGQAAEELVQAADHLMYTGKRAGKNRITFQVLGEASFVASGDGRG